MTVALFNKSSHQNKAFYVSLSMYSNVDLPQFIYAQTLTSNLKCIILESDINDKYLFFYTVNQLTLVLHFFIMLILLAFFHDSR